MPSDRLPRRAPRFSMLVKGMAMRGLELRTWNVCRASALFPFARQAFPQRQGQGVRSSGLNLRHSFRAGRSIGAGALQDMNHNNVDSVTEDKLVGSVKDWLAARYSHLPLGKNGRDDHELLLWFLRDRGFDVEKAGQKLANFIKWRQDFGVSKLTDEYIKKISASGTAYLHTSPDIKGRPVLVVVAAKHNPSEEDESRKLCVHLIEKALESLPPGEEQLLAIVDLRGFGAMNADTKFMKFLIDVFHYYYPKRLGQVLFVDAPLIFQPAWSLVKPLLKSYARLVRFCTTEVVRKEYFTEETVPLDFRS